MWCRSCVIKVANTSSRSIENIAIEKRIFSRFKENGYHRNIVKCIRYDDRGIYLERAEPGCLDLYFQQGGDGTVAERIQWSLDIANALQYVHDLDIRHGDLACKNVLLDSSRRALLCDFAGSGIDGQQPLVRPSEYFMHPDPNESEPCTIKAELHALGSLIHEIMTSKRPYHDEIDYKVAELFRNGTYPDVKHIVLRDIIAKCWAGEYESAREAAEGIDRVRLALM
ncbi:predicted protein [Uncinocarpus reesii 1704]|uniref:EKC/KEOPS complex subunit BUD32 n=1 Tax=Uncinocarpus reesii (strain UAMH 1704) TaxID=336963 RepID=C4JJ94_UNCRE|nr:uncharacterized protein UREG_01701 [Uncinocarpus reesii 1704]EEP76852.1 predicted protein [Uncinocarpus reesii 1704]